MNDWTHVSASQIKAHQRCPSRWYAQKILGIKTPTTAAMALGSKLHKELEHYLLTGDESGLSDRTRPAIGQFPTSVSSDQVERRVDLHTGVVPIVGYIDFEIPTERVVVDHKTTSAWKWCKEPGELAFDAQAIIYCMDALERWGGDEPITFRHVYYRTKQKPGSRTSEVVFEPDEIRERFAALVDHVSTMSDHADLTSWGEVPVNPSACNDYGGCPFRPECRKAGKLGRLFGGLNDPEGDPMSYFSFVKDQTPKPDPVVVAPTPDPVVVAAAVNPPDGTPELEAVELATPKPKPKTTRGVRYRGELVSQLRKAAAVAAWHELMPNDRDQRLWLWQTRGVRWDGESKIGVTAIREDVAQLLEAGATPAADVVQPAHVEIAAALGTNIAPEPVPLPPLSELRAASSPVGGQESPKASPDKPAEPVTAADVLVLYLGCHPQGRAVVYLDELIAPLQAAVADAAGLDHYGMIKFAQGPKQVAGRLAAMLRSGDLTLPRELVIPRMHPCGDVVADVLIPFYRRSGALIIERMG